MQNAIGNDACRHDQLLTILDIVHIWSNINRHAACSSPPCRLVDALDRAFVHLFSYLDFEAAMRLMMDWPAHRRAAVLVLTQPGEASRFARHLLIPRVTKISALVLLRRLPLTGEQPPSDNGPSLVQALF